MGKSGRPLNNVQTECGEKYLGIMFSITKSVDIYIIISFNYICSVGTALLPCSQSIH